MEPKIINQEIFLLTGSSFCSRPFSKRDDQEPYGRPGSMEELEKACWDGMLYQMFPELVGTDHRDNYIWDTVSGVNFLCIQMGHAPLPIERETSIDPYLFFHEACKQN